MKPKIIITKKLLNKYPHARFVALEVTNLKNKKKDAKIESLKKQLEKDLIKNIKDTSLRDRIKRYNIFFHAFNKTVPIAYQLQTICSGKKIPTESVLKDILYMVELKHACLISGHDLDVSKDDFVFDISLKNETYLTISHKMQKLKHGDIILRNGDDIVTSMVYGPGYHDKITEKTENCLYLFWFNENEDEVGKMIASLKKYIKLVSYKNTKVALLEIKNMIEHNNSSSIIDPWGSTLIDDYNKLMIDFYLERFDPKLFPDPNRLMRRGVVFSGLGLKAIAEAIKKKQDFYVLSGIMPTGKKIHFGTKMVVEMMSYFQKKGADTYILIADLEAEATRGISLQEARKRALAFHIPAYIALGLDPEKTTFYFQSDNIEVMHAAYKYSKKMTQAQFEALYGSASPDRIFSVLTQIGDILYPQFKKRRPGVIPVGPDQVPHILASRDVVKRMKQEKFVPPSATFHKYTPALNGHFKMSKSMPESMIELPEDPQAACKKILRAVSGGRDTLKEHKRLGAIVEKDMTFELLKQHLIEDDEELNKIYDAYKSGKMTTGELKKIGCDKITDFMINLEKEILKARKIVNKLKFVK